MKTTNMAENFYKGQLVCRSVFLKKKNCEPGTLRGATLGRVIGKVTILPDLIEDVALVARDPDGRLFARTYESIDISNGLDDVNKFKQLGLPSHEWLLTDPVPASIQDLRDYYAAYKQQVPEGAEAKAMNECREFFTK